MNWLYRLIAYKKSIIMLVVVITAGTTLVHAQKGVYDTLKTYAVIYDGDTIEAKTLSVVDFYAKYNSSNAGNRAKWTRLRNAIIVTFPYASRSGLIINDMNDKLAVLNGSDERKAYIKTRERELKKEFSDPLSNLSIYQGRVLMKLINRETGNNCYDIIKEYKGGLTARFYQTVAFFFSSNLKQPYDSAGEDREMEIILREVCQTYGYNYNYRRLVPKDID